MKTHPSTTIRTTITMRRGTPTATILVTVLALATMVRATARAMPSTTRRAGANACLKPEACACWRCT